MHPTLKTTYTLELNLQLLTTMAPKTPQRKTERREHDTTKRMRFFQAWEDRNPEDGVKTIANLPGIRVPPGTARGWLKTLEYMGEEAFRTQRKRSNLIGRPTKVSAQDLKRLTDQNNPKHEYG